jgi:cytoskeletal protein RodZ
VTLLAPLKHLTAQKLSKLSIFASSSSRVEQFQSPPLAPTAPDPVTIPPTPGEILEQIGGKLRQLRSQQQLSIEDISARTQIQPRLVQAIEEGHIEMLPESVYVKGMVKRYANSLGLDGMAISQQVVTWEPAAATFEPVTRLQTTGFSSPIPQVKPLHIYIGYALAIVGISAATSQLLSNVLKPPAPTAVTLTQPYQPVGIAVLPVTKPPTTLAPVRVGIEVKSPTWAQIGIDGTTKFTGNLKVGTKFDWIATKQITVNTNNAGGLSISHGAHPPQLLGKIGQKQSVTIKVSK